MKKWKPLIVLCASRLSTIDSLLIDICIGRKNSFSNAYQEAEFASKLSQTHPLILTNRWGWEFDVPTSSKNDLNRSQCTIDIPTEAMVQMRRFKMESHVDESNTLWTKISESEATCHLVVFLKLFITRDATTMASILQLLQFLVTSTYWPPIRIPFLVSVPLHEM